MTYAEVIERIIQGVQAKRPELSLDRLRVQADAAFPQINNQVSEAFAADQNRREMLRRLENVTFTDGEADLPSTVLKKFFDDAVLSITNQRTTFRRYPDYARGGDSRLTTWSSYGETLFCTEAAVVGVDTTPYTGAATLLAICAPAIPATENAEFVAPDDYVPDFIDAGIAFLLTPESLNAAAEATQ